jgi:hypothetical protein
VKKNRELHIAAYEKAMADRQDVARAKATLELAKAQNQLDVAKAMIMRQIDNMAVAGGESVPENVVLLTAVQFRLPQPQNRVKDYDAVISMLTLETRSKRMVDSAEHACFILDDWDWKSDFEAVSQQYTSAKMALGLA